MIFYTEDVQKKIRINLLKKKQRSQIRKNPFSLYNRFPKSIILKISVIGGLAEQPTDII